SRYGLSDRVLGLAFSKDGKLAAAGKDGMLHIWDQTASSEALRLRGDPQMVSAVAFSPDGQHLSWAGHSGRVSISNSSGGLETFSLGSFPVEAIAFSPRGRHIACAGGTAKEPRPIQIWDLDHPDNPVLLKGHTGAILALAYSPNGHELAAAGDDMLI